MKIYLASPWFKGREPEMYQKILKKIRSQGYEVYAPIEHEVHDAWAMSNENWGREVFFADIQAIKDCDEVWVLNFGMYSDSGTAWECGYAYGLHKTVRQLVDLDSTDTFSLMMINGCDEYDSMQNYLNDTTIEFKVEEK